MKELRNDLLVLLAGLAMLILGLFILSQKVIVSSGFGMMWGYQIHEGVLFIPLIAGIIWLFASGGKLPAKLLTGLGAAFIVAYIILSVSIHLTAMTLFDWVVLLVLIFGGIGLIVRVLFKNPTTPTESIAKNADDKTKSIEEELENLKKNY